MLLYDLSSGSDAATLGITLGIYPVHVIDQAVGYATFGAGGVRATPYFVAKVVNSTTGTTVYQAHKDTTRAFSADVAADATYAMTQVVQTGTGTNAQLSGRPVAGKTGTTSDSREAWFCGFTPQLATAVFLGRPDHAPLAGGLDGAESIDGGQLPVRMFASYMHQALAGAPVQPFPAHADSGAAIGSVPTASVVPTSPPSLTTAAPPSSPARTAPTTTP